MRIGEPTATPCLPSDAAASDGQNVAGLIANLAIAAVSSKGPVVILYSWPVAPAFCFRVEYAQVSRSGINPDEEDCGGGD